MVIWLTEEELGRCGEFSLRCAEQQQQIEFGQSDTAPRGVAEIGRDNLIGKIAEVAFAKMLRERYGLAVELDFNYYPRGVWDDQDTVINGWQIDVKGTRQGGRWMLIEWSKLRFRQKEGKLSHLYVMASVLWDRDRDVPTGGVDLVGAASFQRLRPGREGTVVLRKHDCIPGTRTHLQADNYGIRFDDLEGDWDKLLHYIRNHRPPNTGHFVVPD